MKKIIILAVMFSSGCLIYGGGKTLNRIEFKGIWEMESDTEVMGRYLGFNAREKLSVFGFCIEVSNDEKSAKIYFVKPRIVYDVKIENIGLNRYNLIYKGKKREFLIYFHEYTKTRRWYFKDTSPKGPDETQRVDGYHYFDGEEHPYFERTVDGLLRLIEHMSSIDSGDNAPPPQK